MAKIKLTQSNYAPIPEGIHVFRIYDVDYDKDFGIAQIHLVNAKGRTHTEKFTTMRDGVMVEGACNALSFFAKTALNNFDLTEIDHSELINHYIKAKVVHTTQPNRNDPTKTVTFVNLTDKWVADGFEEEPCEKAMTLGATEKKAPKQEEVAETGEVDLSALLD